MAGDSEARTRLRVIRDEAREEAARKELVELKQQMLPECAPPPVPEAEREVPVAAL
jgi:hypothetical protein